MSEQQWTRITVKQAKKLKNQELIWWRPNMQGASKIDPEEDQCFVLKD